MRAKPSSNASGMYRRNGSHTQPIPICALVPPSSQGSWGSHDETFSHPDLLHSHSAQESTQDAGMLHDARNLMGAIGLYCDLLSMPGVLHPEHRHYAEELRLLGSRSGALIQRLMEHRVQPQSAQDGAKEAGSGATGSERSWEEQAARSLQLEKVRAATGSSVSLPNPVSLRTIIERCSGLLSRVAGGRVIEVSYGPAAAVPVSVDEEAVERILVNLVRNAAAAMHRPHDPPLGTASVSAAQRSVVLRTEDGTGDDTPGAILIGVGHLVNRVDDPKPWPLRRVRLTVEDSGCGMTQEQLDRIVCGDRAPSRGSHGIGFRVVRELVSASNGDLRVMSAPGIGTRVQIEWPVTQMVHEIAVGTNAASYGVKDSSQLAAASVVVASAVAGRVRERQGARAMQASRAVAVDAGPTFRIDSAVGEERDTVC